MMQSRLDVLDEASRRALRAASVFGETFTNGGVASLLGGVAADAIDDLVARELVERRATSRFAGEAELAFRHGLVRDAAYATLVDDDRLVAHRLAAEWLAAHGEQEALVLATHFERAKESARALPWLVLAAQRAVDGLDVDATFELVKRGEACGASGPALGALRTSQSYAHSWRAEYVRAEAAAVDAMQLIGRGDPLWYVAVSQVLFTANSIGNQAGFLSALAAVVQEPLRGDELLRPQVSACFTVLVSLITVGQRDVADLVMAKLQSAAERSASLDLVAAGWLELCRWAHDEVSAPDIVTGIETLRGASATLDACGDEIGGIQALAFLGLLLGAAGALDESERLLRSAVARCVLAKVPVFLQATSAYLVVTLGRRGEVDEARAVADQVLAGPHNSALEGPVRLYLAMALLDAGEDEDAAAEATRALEAAQMLARIRLQALALLARVHLRAGRTGEASVAVLEARALLREHGVPSWGESRVLLAIAEVLLATDEPEGLVELRAAYASVMERAQRLERVGLRDSFLACAENARILELAGRWLDG